MPTTAHEHWGECERCHETKYEHFQFTCKRCHRQLHWCMECVLKRVFELAPQIYGEFRVEDEPMWFCLDCWPDQVRFVDVTEESDA